MEPEIIGIRFALYRIEAHITREKPRRDDWRSGESGWYC